LIDGLAYWMVSPDAGSACGADRFLACGSQIERVADSSGCTVTGGCDPAEFGDRVSPV
jgi:hypothetical protein